MMPLIFNKWQTERTCKVWLFVMSRTFWFKKAYRVLENAETLFGWAQVSTYCSGSGLVETETQFCCTSQQQALEMALCSFHKRRAFYLFFFSSFSYHKSTTFWRIFQVFQSNWGGRWSALAQWPVSALENWTLPALILMEAPPVVKSIERHFYLPNVEWLGHCPEKWLHFSNTSI